MAERVLVAMSGGVDSAVAAALLRAEGYEVIGVTMRLYTETDDTRLASRRTCCGVEDVEDARTAAQRIGIPHYIINLEREFERDVIGDFVRAYEAGRTPNPCLACNRYIKFSTLLQRAVAIGVDRLATGHYARAVRDGDLVRLHAAADDAKDQSYVLYTLDQPALSRTLFPLGDLTKDETRGIAADLGLTSVADKPDSADICFVPAGDYRALLASRGIEARPGPIVSTEGELLGQHEGTAGFTVGQRKGLRLSGPDKRFVTKIEPQTGTIVVGDLGELGRTRVTASDPHWVVEPPEVGARVHVRARYHAPTVPAVVLEASAGRLEVQCERPITAVAPGQALVLYGGTVGDEVLGGGTIEDAT